MSSLRPAHDIHHRLRWGGDVPLDQVEVMVLDRRRGQLAIPLLGFEPGGRIPWSRVLAYRIAGEVVWDREARIDHVLGSGVDGRRMRTDSAVGGWTWDNGAWVRGDTAPRGVPSGLRALSWNVLFDRYDQERIRTSERHPRLVALLRDVDADLIGLQEIERPFLDRLLGEPWVRRGYASSDGPEGVTVAPYGQVLLSRWPITSVRTVPLDGHKRLLLATVQVRGRDVAVAVLHLSSDHRQNGAARRVIELEALRTELPPTGPVVVLGDFNSDGPIALLDDSWVLSRPDDPGPTFDPQTNALAAAVSSTPHPRRLDRILVRGLSVGAAWRVGEDPSPLPPSDHFGVVVELDLAPVVDGGAPDPHTACVVPLSADVAAVLEPIRRQYDPNRWRWGPHLTLLHGFVSETGLGDLVPALDVDPVTVRLVGVERFVQPGRTLIVVVPDAAGAAVLEALYERMAALAPGCRPDRPFVPHVTVARIEDPREVARVEAEVAALLPLDLRVDHLELWARAADGPMIPRVGARPEGLADTLHRVGAVDRPARKRVRAAALAEAARLGLSAQVVGSEGLGAALPESDLDLAVDRLPRDARAVVSEGIGHLRFSIDGLPVDLAVGTDDPARERDAILAAVAGREDGFRTVLRACKAWAEARQVGDPAWGFPGGLAWAIAVAATAGDDGPGSWWLRTFERLAEEAPIGLGDAPLPEGGAWPRILTLDRRWVVRQGTPATAEVLRAEVERGWVLAADGDWAGLLRPLFAEASAVHLEASETGRAEALGWLRGRARALVEALGEGVRPWPRPTPRRGGWTRVSISVPGDPAEALDDLLGRWRGWRERPAGAELRIAPREG